LSVRDSLPFMMQVGVALPVFDRPEVEGDDNGALDPDKVPPTGATLVVPYLGTLDKDRVSYRWRGSVSGGSTGDYVDLIPATAGKAVKFTVPKQFVTINRHGTVVVDYSIQRDGVPLGTSRELSLRIGVALELTAPRIKEAPNDTTLVPIAAKDALTALVNYTGIALQDKIIVKFTGAVGTPAGGSYTAPEKTVQTLGEQEIPLVNSVVPYNLDKPVTVDYTVKRGSSTPLPSKTLTLKVLPIADGDSNYPTPTIDNSPGPELDVQALTGSERTRIAKWPFIARGQNLWLRYHGTNAIGTPFEKVTYLGTSIPNDGLNGMQPATPVAELRSLKNGSNLLIRFKVSLFGSTDEAKALTFPLRTYVVKSVEDVKPVITDAQDSKNTVIPEAGLTVDTIVTLFGTSALGQKIQLRDGATLAGQPTADPTTGIWRHTLTGQTVERHSFTAQALYGSGQTSDPRTLTVTPATAPTITSVKGLPSNVEIPDTGVTLENSATLSGVAAKGHKVDVLDGQTSKGQPTADVNTGVWMQTVANLTTAHHTFTAKALYAQGAVSTPRTLTVAEALVVDESDLHLTGRNITIQGTGLNWILTGKNPAGTDALRPATGGIGPITYRSLNEQIASVGNTGIVRSEGNGTTRIEVSDAANQTRSFSVTVANIQQLVRNTARMTPEQAKSWINSGGRMPITIDLVQSILGVKYEPRDTAGDHSRYWTEPLYSDGGGNYNWICIAPRPGTTTIGTGFEVWGTTKLYGALAIQS
jgi:hypothetical protein